MKLATTIETNNLTKLYGEHVGIKNVSLEIKEGEESVRIRKYLGEYDWAVPTDLSESSLKISLEKIVGKYEDLSGRALGSFREELNYEKHFQKIKKYLSDRINARA